MFCTIVDHDTMLREVTNLEHTFSLSLLWSEHSDFESINLVYWDVFDIATCNSSDCNCSSEDCRISCNVYPPAHIVTPMSVSMLVSPYLQEYKVANTKMDLSTVTRESQAEKPTRNLYLSHVCPRRWWYHGRVLPRRRWR